MHGDQKGTAGEWTLAGRVRRKAAKRMLAFGMGDILTGERLESLDAALVDHARSAGRLRFEIGRGLEAMARCGRHHEMGFSSVEAYALERLERSASWVQKARRLVR